MAREEKAEVSETEIDSAIKEIKKRNAPPATAPTENVETEITAELTDEYVKTLGEFSDVADFKAKLAENMRKEKEGRNREKKRIEASDKIIEGSTIPLPRLLIESELDKMTGGFKEDLARMQWTLENYLKQIQKTEADLRKEWEPDAIKRAKLQLILSKIAEEEKIEANPLMVEQELEHLMEHLKDVHPERARLYIQTMLRNEEVFKFLEAQK